MEAFVEDERIHQLDLLHLCWTTNYYLWKDDQFPLKERTAIEDEVNNVAFHLKTSSHNTTHRASIRQFATELDAQVVFS